ncbi:MAG: hypothetical protein A2Y93_06420 [Chloroflexi bacterium RBG_13_68_17]|nr:MAG: hypothetical protein A2Y93_06420 [Chloroflexi bacterium RBG_13_68_17]
MTAYEPVIVLETYIQLNTHSKIFCACKADSWGEAASTNIHPVGTGLSHVLPAHHPAAAEKAVPPGAANGGRSFGPHAGAA